MHSTVIEVHLACISHYFCMQAAAALEAEMAEEGGYPVKERSQSPPDREKRKREKWRRSRSRERCSATPLSCRLWFS